MTEEQIQTALNALSTRALSLGLSQPDFRIEFQANCQLYATIRWSETIGGTYTMDSFFENKAEDAIARMGQALDLILPLADRERNEYLKKLAATIEYGKKIGIDEDFVNPLIEQMKKLSGNVIEHQPVTDSDDIPF